MELMAVYMQTHRIINFYNKSNMNTPILFTNLGNLRLQECDRIAAMSTGFLQLGIKVVEGNDWLAIFPVGSTDNDVEKWKVSYIE